MFYFLPSRKSFISLATKFSDGTCSFTCGLAGLRHKNGFFSHFFFSKVLSGKPRCILSNAVPWFQPVFALFLASNACITSVNMQFRNFFYKTAWIILLQLPKTIACIGITQVKVVFCPGDCHIKQTSFFFQFFPRIDAHGIWKKGFFQAAHKHHRKFQAFRRMYRHQFYHIGIFFIIIGISKQYDLL